MCGICGIIGFANTPISEGQLRRMMHVMKNRGPDDEGVFIKENIGLGFVRLSILDLSPTGHQPMLSKDGRYVIVFNGEIFNYIELREKLKGYYNFTSSSDTEVLLASYIKWGKSCLDMLNGMFAFVILDTQTNVIFGARDRFGIKPFYYTIYNNQFVFASDIPPILALLKNKPEAEESVLYDFLAFNRTNHNEKTFFKNIFKLQHGHLFQLLNNSIEIKRWYNLGEKVNSITDHSYTSKSFAEDLSKSVELQLRSDVPLGTCLSGGLDSSSITSLVLNKSKNQRLHSFSAVYGKGIPGDESDFIESYNNSRLNIHYTIPTSESLLSDIDRFTEAISEPLPNTSEYAEFKVMELAKKYCTVILNGQGADEIMAGYHYFFGYYFKDLLKQFKLGHMINEMAHYLLLHKSMLGIQSFILALSPGLIKNKNSLFLNKELFKEENNKQNPIVENFYTSSSLQEFLIKHFEYKFEHHLLWADKSGMYFSLETRFPFLDHNLVERTLASRTTINKGYTKILLRESMKGILPEKVRTRVDKMGYQTPEALWFQVPDFKEYFLDIVRSESFKSRGYLKNSICQRVISRYYKTGEINNEFWKWFSMEMWFRKFID